MKVTRAIQFMMLSSIQVTRLYNAKVEDRLEQIFWDSETHDGQGVAVLGAA